MAPHAIPSPTPTPDAASDGTAAIPPPTPGAAPPATTPTTSPSSHPALAADLIFATFFCAPGIAPADYASRRPDLRFGAAVRAAHPGKKVHMAVLTDSETTVLDDGEPGPHGEEVHGPGAAPAAGGGVEVFRCGSIQRARVGRNSYANWAQMVAQGAYLAHLEALAAEAGSAKPHPPVVFCDTDILVVGDLGEVFEAVAGGAEAAGAAAKTMTPSPLVPPSPPPPPTTPLHPPTPYDYGLTISDAVDMPINFGIQFVPAGGAPRARAFLEGVRGVYDFSRTFVAGQEAVAAFTGVMEDPAANVAVRRAAYGPAGRCVVGCGAAGGAPASFRVAFFPCLKFNYCRCGQSCCTDPGRTDGEAGDHAHAPTTAAAFAAVPVKVFHAVGHRKPGFDVALAAFIRGGPPAAYAAIAALPDEEADYVARFGAGAVSAGRAAAAVEAAVERALEEGARLVAAKPGAGLVPAGRAAGKRATEEGARAVGLAAKPAPDAAAVAAARVAADTATKAAEQAAAAAAVAAQAAAAVVAAAAGVVGSKGVGAKAAAAAQSPYSSGSAPPAPVTAPASRDPSPPRKKAVVMEEESVGVAGVGAGR